MSAPGPAPAPAPAGEGGEEGRAKPSRMPPCVVEGMDKDARVLLFKLLLTGITNKIAHAEKPGVELPPKIILDFVKKGNIYPEGSKDEAEDSAQYIRAVAKLEIKEARDAGDNERAKSLAPLLGMTGDKLVEAAGMRWAYTDLESSKRKTFSKVVQKLKPNANVKNPTSTDYRPFGREDGIFIREAIANHGIEEVLTGGGLKEMSPRSQALVGATSTDAGGAGRGQSPPPPPRQAFAEAADGKVLDSNDWWVLAGALHRRRLAEL